MEEFTIKVFKECSPVILQAESEAEAKAIIESRIETDKLVFHVTQIKYQKKYLG